MANIKDLVLEAVAEMNQEFALEQLRQPDEETILYGDGSDLDSLSLVMLIAEVEQRINDSYGTDLVIASEKALSMRNSPFRSVGALVDYVQSEIANT